VVVIVILAAFVGFAKPSKAFAGTPTRAEKVLIRAINHARAEHGVRKLTIGSTIQRSAHRWANYLRSSGSFYHGSLGYGVRENIAWLTCRSGWQRTIVRMWLNSWSHRPTLLDRSARRLGVGVATGRWSGWGCVRMAVARFK
jgi:uncharacterized protein YkwD